MENQTQTPGSGSMKQSVSMTSLPPPGPQEVSDMAVAKMRLERPYNSLKVSFFFSNLFFNLQLQLIFVK